MYNNQFRSGCTQAQEYRQTNTIEYTNTNMNHAHIPNGQYPLQQQDFAATPSKPKLINLHKHQSWQVHGMKDEHTLVHPSMQA